MTIMMYGAPPFPPKPFEPGGARPWTPPKMPDDAIKRAIEALRDTDSLARQIRELKETVEALRRQVAGTMPDPLDVVRKVVLGLLASHPDARKTIEDVLKETT